MATPAGEYRHWLERARDATRQTPGSASSTIGRWSGRGFLLCTAVAVGYGLWALYGSGSQALRLDVTRPMENSGADSGTAQLGPIGLDPDMNPLRVVLHAAHAPVGSSRLHYEVTLQDEAGEPVLTAGGFFGSRDDEASIVMTRTSLGTFTVPRHGDYYFRVRTFGASMDDVREASLEVRRNVNRVNPGVTWGSGLAALVALVANLVASRLRRSPLRATGGARRAA